MRFPWILTLALVAAAMPTGAQQKSNKAGVKPSREDRPKSSATVKAPRNSSAAELQKIEQQTAKSAVGPKSAGGQHVTRVKTQRDKANLPIRFSSGTDGRGGSSGSGNSSKSRVRTKSSKH